MGEEGRARRGRCGCQSRLGSFGARDGHDETHLSPLELRLLLASSREGGGGLSFLTPNMRFMARSSEALLSCPSVSRSGPSAGLAVGVGGLAHKQLREDRLLPLLCSPSISTATGKRTPLQNFRLENFAADIFPPSSGICTEGERGLNPSPSLNSDGRTPSLRPGNWPCWPVTK